MSDEAEAVKLDTIEQVNAFRYWLCDEGCTCTSCQALDEVARIIAERDRFHDENTRLRAALEEALANWETQLAIATAASSTPQGGPFTDLQVARIAEMRREWKIG